MTINDYDLKMLQKTELGILIDFAKYCDEHNLRYYLIGGALLGAIRYQKFIPWDDDIDVAMPRDDYERLKKEYTSDKYFLQNSQSDCNFARGISKIRLNGTKMVECVTQDINMHQGIYIDIFPIDYVEQFQAQKLAKRGRKIRFWMSLRAIKSGYEGKKHVKAKRIIKKLCPFSIKKIDKKLYALCTKENQKEKKYAILWLHNYSWDKQIHLHDVFGDGAICTFEGQHFISPYDTDAFLKRVFGNNYMEEPSIEKQKRPHSYVCIEFPKEK